MRGKITHDATGTDVPQENGFIEGTADEHVSFRREGQRVDVVAVPRERGRGDGEIRGEGGPQQDGFVVASGGEGVRRADRGPGYGVDAGEVGAESADVFELGCCGRFVFGH